MILPASGRWRAVSVPSRNTDETVGRVIGRCLKAHCRSALDVRLRVLLAVDRLVLKAAGAVLTKSFPAFCRRRHRASVTSSNIAGGER
ncbi:hypothetical protein RCCGE510_30221 (plasmid) [Rhizobium sp. CCGE 510]|nr:hypothetical protein RCCGE510_30221 [Rhizobium sp. CCGE 510]